MLETRKANGEVITGSVKLIHAAGYARASRGEAHQACQEISGADFRSARPTTAEWINAKSVSKIMALRAARDSIIEIKASGEDAEAAVAALVELVAADFPDTDQ